MHRSTMIYEERNKPNNTDDEESLFHSQMQTTKDNGPEPAMVLSPTADEENKSRQLWCVALVIFTTLLVHYAAASAIIHYIVIPGLGINASSSEASHNDIFTTEHGPTQWHVTDSLPHSRMTPFEFDIYVGFVVWITSVLAGFGLEFFVWKYFLQVWDERREALWQFAQFVFPLLLAVSFGLTLTGNYMALIIVIPGLFKFGFPETIMYFYVAMFDKTAPNTRRLADMFHAMAAVLHHSAALLFLCLSLSEHNVLGDQQDLETAGMILIMQHWFVLLAYVWSPGYMVIQFFFEVWFEWSILSGFQRFCEESFLQALICAVMLFAHWLFWSWGIMEFFIVPPPPSDDEENDWGVDNVHIRGTRAYQRRTLSTTTTKPIKKVTRRLSANSTSQTDWSSENNVYAVSSSQIGSGNLYSILTRPQDRSCELSDDDFSNTL